MATYPNMLAWRILWTEEPGACPVLLLFSFSVMSDSLRPLGLQHAKLPLSFTISWSLLKCLSIESVMPSNHLILCRPRLLLPSIFPSIRDFSNELTLCNQVAKVLELQLQHQALQCISLGEMSLSNLIKTANELPFIG